MAKIDLSNISHSYNPNDRNPVYALNPFSMTWENGNRYAILGPSGCGKTTMLNIVSGLVRPSAGRILFDDKDVTDLKTEDRNIAQVFQFPVIYNTMTVYENLAFPLKCRDFSKSKTDERVNSVDETLNLNSFLIYDLISMLSNYYAVYFQLRYVAGRLFEIFAYKDYFSFKTFLISLLSFLSLSRPFSFEQVASLKKQDET